ncbi:hypothetical protein HK405_004084, partial [Cladochytrium tenue]
MAATSTTTSRKQLLRQLGRNGPLVAPVGLGAMSLRWYRATLTRACRVPFFGAYGPSGDEDGIRLLNHAIDVGMTLIDTSDMFGWVRGPDGHWSGIRGDPAYVRECCEKSLERLGVDCIDLYYQHRVDPNTPIEDTVRAMAELVKEGKVKYIGLSEASAATIRRAHAVHPITALQIEYSPWTVDIEKNGILETCEELGIAIVA